MIKQKAVIRKTKDVITEAINCLDDGRDVKLGVRGNSMYPLLVDKRDFVILSKANLETIKKNDIVLYRRSNGQFVLHRIIKVHKSLIDLRGDAQKIIERDVPVSSVLGVTVEIVRKGKKIKVGSATQKIYYFLWSMLLPVRGRIIRWIRKA